MEPADAAPSASAAAAAASTSASPGAATTLSARLDGLLAELRETQRSAAAYREHIAEAERLQGLAVSRLAKHAAARSLLAAELEALRNPRPPKKGAKGSVETPGAAAATPPGDAAAAAAAAATAAAAAAVATAAAAAAAAAPSSAPASASASASTVMASASASPSAAAATPSPLPPPMDAAAAAAAEAQLAEAAALAAEVRDIAPSTGSFFVRLWLGQVNVRAASVRDRVALRDEYEKFKERTNLGFVVFPLVWMLTDVYLRHEWRYTHWIHILTHVWLLYYYVSLSLRENILLANGSKIRPWWITHHYVASAMSIIVLTWPSDSQSWARFTRLFTAYFLYQGLVQFVQGWYQRARHYPRVALGEAHHMDVSHTETLSEFHRGLYPIAALLLVAHVWQIFNGVALLQVLASELNVSQPWYHFREELQCLALGVLFIFLGVTNFYVTCDTVVEKFAKERRRAAEAQQQQEAEEEAAAAAVAAAAEAEAAAAAAAATAAAAAAAEKGDASTGEASGENGNGGDGAAAAEGAGSPRAADARGGLRARGH
jgi:hypothetical protein